MKQSLVLPLSCMLCGAFATFKLVNPPALSLRSSLFENSAPCGGPVPSLTNTSLFFAPSDFVTVSQNSSDNATASYIIQATIDVAASSRWMQIWPEIETSGYGSFCIPQVPVPDDFDGRAGYVRVVAQASDGVSYQCAAVNFNTSGGNAPTPETCFNSSSLQFLEPNTTFTIPPDATSTSMTATGTGSTVATATATNIADNAVVGSYIGVGGLWALVAAINSL